MTSTKLESWQKKLALPLVVLSLLYTFVYVYPIFAYPVSTTTSDIFQIAEYTIWTMFIIDYAVQLRLASRKKYIPAK